MNISKTIKTLAAVATLITVSGCATPGSTAMNASQISHPAQDNQPGTCRDWSATYCAHWNNG